jgi:asparagine synthase (glutamine-hydrolysing)
MTRWLAGAFDPHGGESARIAGALAPHAATVIACGPLTVAHSGAVATHNETLCLLDGHLDNATELSLALGCAGGESVEGMLALGYRRWGRALLPRLRGDFALLIWDRAREQGLLARDQLGVRSLFVHEWGRRLCFASEVRHLLALLPRRPAPDPVGVAHWVAISGRAGTGTLYEGVRRVNPGSALMLGGDGVQETRYWSPRYTEPLELSPPELSGRVRESIARAVERRLDRHGVTGVLMSGGLDSSAVAATAQSLSPPGAVAAFSAEFPDHPEVDESESIACLRDLLGLGGTTAEVRAGGLLDGALRWIGAWQLPLSSWGEFWAGPLLEAAGSAGARIVLGGDGGDELFDCRAYLMADRVREGRLFELPGLVRSLPGAAADPPRSALVRAMFRFAFAGAIPPGLEKLWLGPQQRRRLPRWLRAQTRRAVSEQTDQLAWKRLDGPRWWAYDAHVLTRGVEELGVFENHRRRAALAGLQSRHPLFDLDLVELSLSLPPSASFDPSLDRPLLREAMRGLLPDPVRCRRGKALFDSLLIDSLSGPDRAAIDTLLSNRARLAAYVDMGQMRHCLLDRGPQAAHRGFRWMYQVWRLATAECWLRACEQDDLSALSRELKPSSARVELRAVSPRSMETKTDHTPYRTSDVQI